MAMQRRISRAESQDDRPRSGCSHRRPVADTDLLWQARMSTQAPEIDGFCYVNDFAGAPPRRGEIRRMRITEAHDYDLIGTLDVASEACPLPGRGQRFPDLWPQLR
jgi:ribosomal protein S12 methylthiotransferase